VPFQERSTHFAVFRELHSEINRIFWASTASLGYVNEALSATVSQVTPYVALGKFLPKDQEFTRSLSSWQRASDSSSNWLGLSIVTAIASHFEVYIAGIVQSSLESDPDCINARSRQIDGVQQLKHAAAYEFAKKVEQCTKGDWTKRLAEMRKLFVVIPPQLDSSVVWLDNLRKLRNGAAHKLGREMKHAFALGEMPNSLKPPSVVTASDVVSYLKETKTLAKAVDEHFLTSHIGAYEVVRLYHDWQSEPDTTNGEYVDNPTLRFRKYAAHRWGWQLGKSYSTSLAAYYANC
jgi:hypothetical protein